jgi:protein-S-isoprenylcysteine O-methyltransferase Ste14
VNPPALFLAGLVAVVVISAVAPFGGFSGTVFEAVGLALIMTGLGLNVSGSNRFERAGTPIRPGSRGGALVTDGVFRFSRNPMYLGMAAALLGAALILGSPLALVVVPAFVWVIDRSFVSMEERILEEEFGEAYRRYRARVRRWI